MQDEIARVAPAFAGVTSTLVQRARDGVVLPIAEHPDEIVLRRLAIPLTDASWEPIVPGQVDGGDPVAAAAEVVEAETEVEPAADGRRKARPTSPPPPTRPQPTRSPAIAPPALHRWRGGVASTGRPGRDAYALRLVSSRALYDGGVLARPRPPSSPLVRAGELRVHHTDRDRIGVADGEVGAGHLGARAARAAGPGRRHRGPAAPRCSRGTCPTSRPATLVDAADAVTDLRVESLR